MAWKTAESAGAVLVSQLETDDLVAWAVVWPVNPDARADEYGKQRIGAPTEVAANWTGKVRRKSLGPQSDAESGSATVYVACKVAVGSIMWEGKLKDLPPKGRELFEVSDYSYMDDVKHRERRHWVTVAKFKGELPKTI